MEAPRAADETGLEQKRHERIVGGQLAVDLGEQQPFWASGQFLQALGQRASRA